MLIQQAEVKSLTDIELLDAIERLNMSDEWSADDWNLWNEITAERKNRDSERRCARLQAVYSGGYR